MAAIWEEGWLTNVDVEKRFYSKKSFWWWWPKSDHRILSTSGFAFRLQKDRQKEFGFSQNKNSTKSIILVNLSRCVCLIWWAGRLEIFKIAKSCWWTVKLDSGRLIRAKNDLNERKKLNLEQVCLVDLEASHFGESCVHIRADCIVSFFLDC